MSLFDKIFVVLVVFIFLFLCQLRRDGMGLIQFHPLLFRTGFFIVLTALGIYFFLVRVTCTICLAFGIYFFLVRGICTIYLAFGVYFFLVRVTCTIFLAFGVYFFLVMVTCTICLACGILFFSFQHRFLNSFWLQQLLGV